MVTGTYSGPLKDKDTATYLIRSCESIQIVLFPRISAWNITRDGYFLSYASLFFKILFYFILTNGQPAFLRAENFKYITVKQFKS